MAICMYPPSFCHGDENRPRPKIGLVLGGGGAKGTAHVGVLKVIEELRIPVDYIAGTSMGAVVGSLYAAGYSAAEIEKILTNVDWEDIFNDNPPRDEVEFRRKQEDFTYMVGTALGVKDGRVLLPKSVISGQKIGVFFETLFMPVSDVTDFDHLPIPYRAVAADLETGDMVVIRSGRLAEAAKASMTVPGVFPPAEVQGRYLTDGGIVRNLPVDIVKEMGAEVIIAVDVGKPLKKREELGMPTTVMFQMLDIMIKANVQAQIDSLGEKDVFIRPDLGTLESGDFKRAKEGIERGEEAARKQIEKLRRYSADEESYAGFLSKHRLNPVTTVRVGSVTVAGEGLSRVPKEAVETRLKIKPDEQIDTEELKNGVSRIYGMDEFERIDLHIDKRGDAYDILLKPVEKSWGPDYLKFGLNLETNFSKGSSYNILVDYTKRWLNRYGGEWKTSLQIGERTGLLSEFYQPLNHARSLFIAPYVSAGQNFVDVYDGHDILAEYRLQELQGGIDFGTEPRAYGEFRIGYVSGLVKPKLQKGDFDIPDETIHKSALRMRLIADQLDNVNFPRKGFLGQINYYASLHGLGADDEYHKLDVRLLRAFTFDKYTVAGGMRYGTYIGNHLPFYDTFSLGGFLNLSGLATDQLRGERIGLVKLVFYWQAARSLVGDFYLGGSLETGNAWRREDRFSFDDLRAAGSVFVGYDSLLGPLYLGYGHADEGFDALYLYLGRTF
jgi:NTE family protein